MIRYYCILTYAYGKSVESTDELLAAWEGGKDFKINNGPYCSIRNLDILKKDFDYIQLRGYNKKRTTVFEIGIYDKELMRR